MAKQTFMQSVISLSHGKINLGLQVMNKRSDGYHDLNTVMVKLKLSDVLTVNWHDPVGPNPETGGKEPWEICLTTNDSRLPCDYRNLAYKAAHKYLQRLADNRLDNLLPRTVEIHLEKHVPFGAGMGGGSSNAASTISVLHSIARAKVPPQDGARLHFDASINLEALALEIGSDVPFFLGGPVSIAKGRGEVLTPVKTNLRFYVVCAMPYETLSTKDVYEAFDSFGPDAVPNIDLVVKSLENGSTQFLPSAVQNSLERAAASLVPQVRDLKNALLLTNPLCCSMTGSGSCVFGLYTDSELAEKALEPLLRHKHVAWCTLTETINEVC